MLCGLNHITLAVSDIDRSFAFYVELLGFEPRARWSQGAYLTLAELWLCLSVDDSKPAQDYSHIAFSVSDNDFSAVKDKIINSGVKIWKQNRSEGDSLYFLDPDEHKLEIHVGDINSRLDLLKQKPYQGLKFF